MSSEEFRNQLKEELLQQPTHVEWEGEDFQELLFSFRRASPVFARTKNPKPHDLTLRGHT